MSGDNIDEKIVSTLEKLSQIYRVLLWDVAKEEGLSPIQIQFIIFLNRYPEEMRKVSNLAKEFDLTKATVSEAVSNLEDKGIITRNREKKDKRSYILDLTKNGAKVVKRIENWQNVLLKKLSTFSPEIKEKAMIFLMELIKSLYDDGVINIARMCIACENFVRKSDKKGHFCSLTRRVIVDRDLTIGCNNFK